MSQRLLSAWTRSYHDLRPRIVPRLRCSPWQGRILYGRTFSSLNAHRSQVNAILPTELSPNEKRPHLEYLVQRFFGSIWNDFDLSAVPEIVSPDLVFRGSLRPIPGNINDFAGYHKEVEAAFPDFYQRIDAIYTDGDVLISKMSWSATHTGTFRGIEPSGRRFMYPGIFIAREKDGKIVELFSMGDSWNMYKVIQEGGSEVIEESVWAGRKTGGRENEWKKK
ncbi:NTF2-like protein [Rhizodiscina lignyota]|uniref:NTF2-like protein n=1 Tax=Rhizodiscina lignyota TaxID=1504668 RepID=A0A9P4M966_9PEZI|nr:NTF2-like protein [Rhizodiscina lignyota]